MNQSEVLYVPQVAQLLGMTEAALRAHVYRRTKAVPSAFKLGRKLAWRRESVQEFLRRAERAP